MSIFAHFYFFRYFFNFLKKKIKNKFQNKKETLAKQNSEPRVKDLVRNADAVVVVAAVAGKWLFFYLKMIL